MRIGFHFEGQYTEAVIVDGKPERFYIEEIELNCTPDLYIAAVEAMREGTAEEVEG